MFQQKMLIIGLVTCLFISPVLSPGTEVKGGTYEFKFVINRFPLYFEFFGTTEMSVVITPRIDTDYGTYENVKTIEYLPFVMNGTGLDGTLSFLSLKTFLDNNEREIGAISIMKFNITRMGSFRIDAYSYRGNYTGTYPIWSEVFSASSGTKWSYSYEETVHGNISSNADGQLPFANTTNGSRPTPTLTPTNTQVILELEGFETKTVAAGTFFCAHLKQFTYENGNYTGYRALYRTQIGDTYPFVLQEDYTEEDKLMFAQELISLDPSQAPVSIVISQTNSWRSIISQATIFLLFRLKYIIPLLIGGIIVIILIRRSRTRRLG